MKVDTSSQLILFGGKNDGRYIVTKGLPIESNVAKIFLYPEVESFERFTLDSVPAPEAKYYQVVKGILLTRKKRMISLISLTIA